MCSGYAGLRGGADSLLGGPLSRVQRKSPCANFAKANLWLYTQQASSCPSPTGAIAVSILLRDLGVPEHLCITEYIVPVTHASFNVKGKEMGLWASPSPPCNTRWWREACPPILQGRLRTAGEVSLTCLLAENLGCLMKILLAKWILLKSIFWFIPPFCESQLIIISFQCCCVIWVEKYEI